jgi:hypothetical protein
VCEAGGAKRVLKFHLPNRTKSNADMLSVEESELEPVTHFGCFGQSVSELIVVISVWCETYSQGAHALCDFDPLDVVMHVEVRARG